MADETKRLSIYQAELLASSLTRQHDLAAQAGQPQAEVWNLKQWLLSLLQAIEIEKTKTMMPDGWWNDWFGGKKVE